jgi:hypothetical protein
MTKKFNGRYIYNGARSHIGKLLYVDLCFYTWYGLIRDDMSRQLAFKTDRS